METTENGFGGKSVHSLASFWDYIENQEKQWLKKARKDGEAMLSFCLEFTYTKDATIK